MTTDTAREALRELSDAECDAIFAADKWHGWPQNFNTLQQGLMRDACRVGHAAALREDRGTEPEVTFTLREASELVEAFGRYDASEMTVRKYPAGAIPEDPSDPGDGSPSPAGLWAYATDYPEEGAIYLGPVAPDAAPIPEDQVPTFEDGIAAAIRVIEGGRFLHDNAPPARFAKEVVAAIRERYAPIPESRAEPTVEQCLGCPERKDLVRRIREYFDAPKDRRAEPGAEEAVTER